jgi:NTP pyrophosphatase (non-canonical NTP hydrolase)
MADLHELTDIVLKFRDERDWKQFHTPKNLSAGLAVEAAELQEEFLCKTDSEVSEFLESKKGHAAVSDELADVMIFGGFDPSYADTSAKPWNYTGAMSRPQIRMIVAVTVPPDTQMLRTGDPTGECGC